jgi:methyl-accepting chemotaxis protein
MSVLSTTKSKLFASFAVTTLLSLLLSGVSIFAISSLGGHVHDLGAGALPSVGALADAQGAFMSIRLATMRAVLGARENDHGAAASQRTHRDAGFKQFEVALKKFAEFPMDEKEKEIYGAIEAGLRYYSTENGRIWDRLAARDAEGAAKIQMAYAEEVQRRVADPLMALMDLQEKQGVEESAAAESINRTASRSVWVIAVLVVLASVLLGFLVARSVASSITLLVSETSRLSEAVSEGKLDVRGDREGLSTEFRPIIDGMNETMEAFEKPMKMTAECVASIGQGKIPPKITETYRGDFDLIKSSLNDCIDAVNLMVSDTAKLVETAVAGQLSNRADAAAHQGDFRKVVDGINKTLDAVIAPVTEAIDVLERLSQRDLRARVSSNFQGDHARIKDAVNATGEALQEAMLQVAAAVEQVSSASTQIASSSQAVAAGASEQAASLQETTSSLEAVAGMTKQSADNAAHANALSQTARSAATDGASSVEQMQGAMSKIKASAEGTSQIIKDINDIAFQTNLLALNAAVEAARAGEAGRGFAVVAEEVRSLALRAKEAAMKTEELIRESVKQAGEGEATSRLVAGKLAEIVAGIGKVTDIVSEIAAASKEQSAGIDQVNRAVTEMDKVTQQNAASAEESSSAASELNGQAEELAAMVGAFQMDRGTTRSALKRPDAGVKPTAARRSLAAATSGSRPAPKLKGKPAIDERFPMDAETELVDF